MLKIFSVILGFAILILPAFSQESASKTKTLEDESLRLFRDGKLDEAILKAKELADFVRQANNARSDELVEALVRLANFRKAKIEIEEKPLLGKRAVTPLDFDAARNESREAEANLREALSFCEKIGKSDSPIGAGVMHLLALILQKNYIPQPVEISRSRIDEAELLFTKALSIQDRLLGEDHEKTLRSLADLIALYNRFENHSKILSLSPKYITNGERTFRQNPANLLTVLKIYASTLHLLMRDEDLKLISTRIKQLDPEQKGDLFPVRSLIGRRINLVMPRIPVEAGNYTDGKINVTVKIEVNEKGNVVRASIDNDVHYLIKDAILEAAKNSSFKPMTVDGKPLSYRGNLPYNLTVSFNKR